MSPPSRLFWRVNCATARFCRLIVLSWSRGRIARLCARLCSLARRRSSPWVKKPGSMCIRRHVTWERIGGATFWFFCLELTIAYSPGTHGKMRDENLEMPSPLLHWTNWRPVSCSYKVLRSKQNIERDHTKAIAYKTVIRNNLVS